MKSRKFELLHPNCWKVLKVRKFEYKRGNCDTTGTIVYERPFKDSEYTKETNDVVDETIKKGITSLFGEIDCYSHIIQWIGEEDDYKKHYCVGKQTAGLIIRCMPIVDIKPTEVDCEKEFEGFDFEFNIYLDYVEQGLLPPSILILSGYDPKDQQLFNQVSKIIKEL